LKNIYAYSILYKTLFEKLEEGKLMHVVLYMPQIPQNTGNIARTCAATGITLHLIEPLGFSLEDRYLKRAGLDYWDNLKLKIYPGLSDFYSANKGGVFRYLSTKAKNNYYSIAYGKDDYFIFGPETKGLPEELLIDNIDNTFRIPMLDGARSLNLSNSVAIVVYEVLRQQGFDNMLCTGKFADGAQEILGHVS
jgi:tRNA (cytidine/uridine-2'-O-)-methyltransferase